jgi:hypothetical protein
MTVRRRNLVLGATADVWLVLIVAAVDDGRRHRTARAGGGG